MTGYRKLMVNPATAEALRQYCLTSGSEFEKGITNYLKNKDGWFIEFEPLKYLSLEEISIALLNGWEIVDYPDIAVGDIVAQKGNPLNVGVITSLNQYNINLNNGNVYSVRKFWSVWEVVCRSEDRYDFKEGMYD